MLQRGEPKTVLNEDDYFLLSTPVERVVPSRHEPTNVRSNPILAPHIGKNSRACIGLSSPANPFPGRSSAFRGRDEHCFAQRFPDRRFFVMMTLNFSNGAARLRFSEAHFREG